MAVQGVFADGVRLRASESGAVEAAETGAGAAGVALEQLAGVSEGADKNLNKG
jgi:hypothetical protein